MKKIILALILLDFICQLALAQDGTVSVEIYLKNIKTNAGPIHISLATEKDDFPSPTKTPHRMVVPSQKGSIKYTFRDVIPGRYAVSLYQDSNQNNQLDKYLFGIPKEPYALSGQPGFGKPKFEDCAIDIYSSKTIELELKN